MGNCPTDLAGELLGESQKKLMNNTNVCSLSDLLPRKLALVDLDTIKQSS